MRLRSRLASRGHLRHLRRLRLLPRLRLLAVSARAPMAQLLRVCAERSGLLEAVFAPKLAAAMTDPARQVGDSHLIRCDSVDLRYGDARRLLRPRPMH